MDLNYRHLNEQNCRQYAECECTHARTTHVCAMVCLRVRVYACESERERKEGWCGRGARGEEEGGGGTEKNKQGGTGGRGWSCRGGWWWGGERRDTDPEASLSVPCSLTAFIHTETTTT